MSPIKGIDPEMDGKRSENIQSREGNEQPLNKNPREDEGYRSQINKEFSDYFRNKGNGLKINIYDFLGRPEDLTKDKTCAFKLQSDKLVEDFYTIWPIFRQKEFFDRVIEEITNELKRLNKDFSAKKIVTCTATAKHLLEHVQYNLGSDYDDIESTYLGDFPIIDLQHNTLLDYKGKNVLIFTDIVSSGNLVRKMAEVVHKVGGQPVGVLSLAIISSDIHSESSMDGWDGSKGKSLLRYYSITSFPDTALNKELHNSLERKIEIDAFTILPKEEETVSDEVSDGEIPFSSLIDHFETSNAIDFGLYQNENKRFLSAFRIEKLLSTDWLTNEVEHPIWSAIKTKIEKIISVKKDVVFVTTYNREDIWFTQFVTENKPGYSVVTIPKIDSIDESYSYFVPFFVKNDLEGKDVIILLSTVNTAQKLRNLISLLAYYGVNSIDSFALINRMGDNTNAFIKRINLFLKGRISGSGSLAFSFTYVYRVAEIESNDLEKMTQSIQLLFEFYSSATNVISFRKLMEQDRIKYFKPKSIYSKEFYNGVHNADHQEVIKLLKLPKEYQEKLSSLQSAIFYCYQVAIKERNYSSLISFLFTVISIPNKEFIYNALAVVFSNLSFLKLSGEINDIREEIVKKLDKLRTLRFSLEDNKNEESDVKIKSTVDSEAHLIFVLSVLSYLDQEGQNQMDNILNAITSGKSSPKFLHDNPKNSYYYYSSERVGWTISLLIHLTYPNLRDKYNKHIRSEILEYIDEFLNPLEAVIENYDKEILKKEKVKSMISQLRSDVEGTEHEGREAVLRFLFSRLLYKKSRHSPIISSLDSAIDQLSLIAENTNDSLDKIRITDKDVKTSIDQAIHYTGILEEIALKAGRLYSFTDSKLDEIMPYVAEPQNPISILYKVSSLSSLLEKVRQLNIFHIKDVQEIERYKNEMIGAFWDEESKLIQTLKKQYLIPLEDSINTSIHKATAILNESFSVDVEFIKDNIKDKQIVFDLGEFLEILTNLIENSKHSLDELEGLDEKPYLPILVDINVYSTHSQLPDVLKGMDYGEYVEIRIFTKGRVFDIEEILSMPSPPTLLQHASLVEKFGGKLIFEPSEDRSGMNARLFIKSRFIEI